jgi:signal transduction histidine kinase
MHLHDWFRPPRYLLTLLLAVTFVASAALVWLGWRLLDQERAVVTQRAVERRENAADRVVAIFQRNLHELEVQLSPGASGLPDDAVVLLVASRGTMQARPPQRLVFYPPAIAQEAQAADVFRAGETAEFSGATPTQAIAIYRELARSTDRSVRAGSLVRLGRSLRKAVMLGDALQAYSDLRLLGDATVAGLPAELVAREARCTVLERMGRRDELEREAQSLYRDLETGRYQLQHAAWSFFLEEAKAWAGPGVVRAPSLEGAIALSAAAESLWNRWQDLPASGNALLVHQDQPVLAVWTATPEQLTAVLAGRRYLEAISGQAAREAQVRIAISDRDGTPVLGAVTGPEAVRGAIAIHQPWNLRISSAVPEAESAQDRTRRQLLLSGLAIAGALILAGGYFAFSGIHRELAVAQLQSDFVAAVSHEFRTPLTSMRQLSQMLSQGRVIQEGRRQQYYDVLARESERLHRLVEGLLNFGRMEAGAVRYRLESVDAAELVRSVGNSMSWTRGASWCRPANVQRRQIRPIAAFLRFAGTFPITPLHDRLRETLH